MVTQRLIDKLLEFIISKFASGLSSSSEGEVLIERNRPRGEFQSLSINSSNRIERMTNAFQILMLKCWKKIKSSLTRSVVLLTCKFHSFAALNRLEWVTGVLIEGFQRAVTSFTEILHREFVTLGDENYVSIRRITRIMIFMIRSAE